MCKNLAGFEDSHGALYAFSSGMAYCIGGFGAGPVADRYFQGRLKTMLLWVYVLGEEMCSS